MFADFFNTLNVWHWLILGVVLMLTEMLAPGFIFLWFGVAAIATGLIFAAVPGTGWEVQVVAFAVLSAIAIFVGRRVVSSRPQPTDHPTLNQRSATYIGHVYVLKEPMQNGTGKIVIDDTMWKVAGPDAPAGTRVKVVGADGVTLLIEPAP